MAEYHVSSEARQIVPQPFPVRQELADGWSERRQMRRDPNLVPVVHSVREFALATTASTRVVASQPDPEPAPAPRPMPTPKPQPPPKTPDLVPVEPDPAPTPAPEIERRPRILLEARFRDTRVSTGEPGVLEFTTRNVGTATARDIVVEVDLPPALEHRLGRALSLEIGDLPPGAVHRARLVTTAAEDGRWQVALNLKGEAVAASRTANLTVGRRPTRVVSPAGTLRCIPCLPR